MPTTPAYRSIRRASSRGQSPSVICDLSLSAGLIFAGLIFRDYEGRWGWSAAFEMLD